jgi:ABC-type phosphate transport system substrate-binding protein
MRSTLRSCAVVAVGAAAALSLGLGSATADPNLLDNGSADPSGFLPNSDDLVGTGSDTIQFATDFLARGYNASSPSARLASYDATNPTTGLPGGSITLRDPDQVPGNGDEVVIARPNGSGAGITTLINNTNVDFARSSRPSNGSTAEDALAFIPFANDGLSYIVDDASLVPTNLSAADLRDIYTCQLPGYSAKLPQAGSGTRSFFLQQIGVTEAQIATAVAAGCVDDTVQEHNANAVDGDPFALAPFSAARYVSNPPDPSNPPSNVVTLASDVDPGAFKVTRKVYHVIRESAVGTSKFDDVFGPDGYVCDQFAAAPDQTVEGFVGLTTGCGIPDADV